MATITLNHPVTGHNYTMEYDMLGTVIDHRGKYVNITDWHVLHPTTLREMGVSKPLDIASYLFDLSTHNSQQDFPSTSVRDFIQAALYFLTDGCLLGTNGLDKPNFLVTFKDYLYRYTPYRKSFTLWSKLWDNLQPGMGVSSSSSGFIQGTGAGVRPTYELIRRGTYVKYREEGVTSRSSRPSCDEKWLGIKNYTFKMDNASHRFFRHLENEFYDSNYPQVGVPMFGLELEVSSALHPDELQYVVCDMEPKQEPFFVMKQDTSITGSMRNNYEIVTVPTSPRYMKKAFSILFTKLEKRCQELGMSMADIFDLSTDLGNGIHIHVDRRSFHNNKKRTHIARFLSAFNLGDTETARLFTQLSRRPGDYRTATYCSIDRSLDRYKTGYKLKEAGSSGHRGCTSMRQTSTVEVRIFQGIVDIGHIRSCIEATQAMLDYTYLMPLSTLNRKFASGFKDFVLKSGKYNTLRKELK